MHLSRQERQDRAKHSGYGRQSPSCGCNVISIKQNIRTAFTSDRSSTASMLGSPATFSGRRRCSQNFSKFIQYLEVQKSSKCESSRIFQIYKSRIWATNRDQTDLNLATRLEVRCKVITGAFGRCCLESDWCRSMGGSTSFMSDGVTMIN